MNHFQQVRGEQSAASDPSPGAFLSAPNQPGLPAHGLPLMLAGAASDAAVPVISNSGAIQGTPMHTQSAICHQPSAISQHPASASPSAPSAFSAVKSFPAPESRRQSLIAYATALQSGCSSAAAALAICHLPSAMGPISRSSLDRYAHRLIKLWAPDSTMAAALLALLEDGSRRAHVLSRLTPKTDQCGRSSPWQHLVEPLPAPDAPRSTLHAPDALTPFAAKLLALYVATIGSATPQSGAGRRSASMAAALKAISFEPECPAELAALLRRGKFPAPLTRFLAARLTPEAEQRLRGQKHASLFNHASRRDRHIRFPNGDRALVPAGYRWVFDDMSLNQPFFHSQASGVSTALQQGAGGAMGTDPRAVLFSRQGLYAIDHASLRWLGLQLVAREREAYTAADILRFLRNLFETFGKPEEIVFEQAIWRARKLRGYNLDPARFNAAEAEAEEEFLRPEMSAQQRDLLSQGLAALGIRLLYVTTPRAKIIEGAFHPLQTHVAMLTREFNNLGRHAGEFEAVSKRLRQVRAGRDPAQLGFIPMAVASDRVHEAMRRLDDLPKETLNGLSPDQVWDRDLAARPLAPLLPDDYQVFLPELRERQLAHGRVSVTVNGQTYDYREAWMADLGAGYQVFLRFDPEEPWRGAAIYNRQGGAANHHAYAFQQFLGFAAWEVPGPVTDTTATPEQLRVTARQLGHFYGPGATDQGDTKRRAQDRRAASIFRALPRPGQPKLVAAATKRSEAGALTGKTDPSARSDQSDRSMPLTGSARPRIRVTLAQDREALARADQLLANIAD